jgi:hypothetical protein
MVIDDATGKVNVTTVSAASMNAAVAAITTGSVTSLTATAASVASMNAGVALLTTATVTTLNASGASIASANIGNLQFTAASIASINAGVAVINNLTATSASIASANVGTAVITIGTLTNLTATSASVASANAAVALITTGTVTSLTATSASVASANVGTAVITGLTVTGASIASVNAGTATLSGNLTLNGGTANGVLYLDGSKVATSGSALTYNGTDFSNTAGKVIAGSDLRALNTGTGNIGLNIVRTGGTTADWYNFIPSGSDALTWYKGSELMRLDTTGLGIGTSSPTQKLHVAGNILSLSAAGTDSYVNVATSGVQNTYMGFNNSGSTNASGVLNNHSYFGSGNAYGVQFITNGAVAATIDSSGNLGLGVTPSAWGSVLGLQVRNASVSSLGGNTNNTNFGSNWYYDGSDFRYIGTAAATNAKQLDGAFQWFTAPSGTAGNAISFTQALTLDASGNLLVGDTANSAGARLYVKGSGATSGSVAMVVRNSTPSDLLYIRNDGYMTFGISPAMTLTAGGDLLVGTTTYQSKRITIDGGSGGAVWANCSTSANPVNVTYNTATSGDNLFEEFYTDGGVLRGTISYNRGAGQVSYNVTSDARLKDNIADAADAGNKVDALQVRQFDWKETGNHVDYGFIAQELHEVAPQAVSKPEDDEKMWSVDYSKLVPMLVKEIQSLRARVAQLESK